MTFRINVLFDGHQVRGVMVQDRCRPGDAPAGHPIDRRRWHDPALRVFAGTMKEPGFLRLIATAVIDGRTYRGVGTAWLPSERIS